MFQSDILETLGCKHKTDKCKSFAAGHDYLRKYEFFFRPFKDKSFTFMELGVFKGGSLKTWSDYFSKARIVGVDCVEETKMHAGGRVEIILGDLGKLDFLKSLAAQNAQIIMDDASHWWADQLRSLFVLFPALPSGGIYVVEDIHTSFEPLVKMFSAGFHIPPFTVLTKIAEYMTANEKEAPVLKGQVLQPIKRAETFHEEIRYIADNTDAVVFIERACIIIKK